MHFGLKHSKNCRCAACNTKLAQLVLDRAYNLMLDSAALQQQRRLYIQDVVTYGTGVVKMVTADYPTHDPHDCLICNRPASWIELETKRTQARARTVLVLGVLAFIAALVYWGR
jgi:hypothetical protein